MFTPASALQVMSYNLVAAQHRAPIRRRHDRGYFIERTTAARLSAEPLGRTNLCLSIIQHMLY